MKVATIVPTCALQFVADDYYHLCLVQELRKKGEYYGFYKRMVHRNKFVIVDNGAAEGECASIEEVYDLTMDLGASELQLPDVFFDKEETQKKVDESLKFLSDKGYEGSIMVVPQGKNLQEWLECADYLINRPDYIDTVGIPKNLVHTEGRDGRIKASRELTNILGKRSKPFVRTHLLGVWTDPREVYEVLGSNRIRGVDSGIAAIYTQAGLLLDPDKYEKPGGNKAYLDFDNNDIDFNLLKVNIERWKGACYNGRLL